MARPVFYDPSGRRRRWTRRAIFATLIVLVLSAVAFASTVVSIPTPSPLPLGLERRTPLRFRAQVSNLSHSFTALFRSAPKARANAHGAHPLTVAFYTTWSDDSAPSLIKHIDQIDWVAPTTLAIDKTGRIVIHEDRALRRILLSNIHRPLVMPVLQNVAGDVFSGAATQALLHSPQRRKALIAGLSDYLAKTGDAGIIFDFENLNAGDMVRYRQLVAETNAAFDKSGKVVAVTLPMEGEGWSPQLFAKAADKIILMAYDEHWMTGKPGPIASNGWFSNKVASAIRSLPADKVIIALGSYAYDWREGGSDPAGAASLTIEEAWSVAHDSSAMPTFDKGSGNTGFSYLENGQRHDVWMLDAAASWNQMRMLSHLGVGNIALWRLGSEDPGFWRSLGAWRTGGNTTPDFSRMAESANVDVEGQGEILRVTSTPTTGQRSASFDTRTNIITDLRYTALPSPYIVQRTGALPKKVALTFDDGPDPTWTPRILSILEQYQVPAAFFIVGENGVQNRPLLERMVRDGMEIGNHSYTHPN
ncbi:MAG TPA: polysaccharide deacetylase family protein, partial [Novosphingobium sp.]|nr:polysaccharide deacetylase family protein [Novosphingobium sp.]